MIDSLRFFVQVQSFHYSAHTGLILPLTEVSVMLIDETALVFCIKYLFVCSCLTSAKCYLVVAMQPNFSGCVF